MEFFKSPEHPYIRRLVSSIAVVSDKEETLKPKNCRKKILKSEGLALEQGEGNRRSPLENPEIVLEIKGLQDICFQKRVLF